MRKSNIGSGQLEYDLKEDDILYFLHIQKTAGTTLMNILDSYFDLDTIYSEQFWRKLLPNIPNDFAKYKLVRGHFGYGLHRILPKKPVYITMLRDPIERTISDYEHIRRENINTKEHVPKNETILDVLKNPRTRWTYVNPQTAYIEPDLDIVSLTKSWNPERVARFEIRSALWRAIKTTPENKLLENAKKHLSEFAFVGIVERFEESLFLLYYTFGWKPMAATWKLNVAPKHNKGHQLTEEALKEIIDCTRLDAELYKFAQEIFEQRYEKMVEELREKYYEPSFANLSFREMMYKLLEKHFQQRSSKLKPKQLTSIDYDFRSKLSGTGWYWREIFEESGEAFRWTGPDTISTIEFPLSNEEDLIVQFRVIRTIIPSLLDNLKLRVNNQTIDIKVLYQKGEKTVFEGFIPKTALQGDNGIVNLSFEVEKTINPHEVNPLDPTDRPLGIALDRIRIIPAKVYNRRTDKIDIHNTPFFSKNNIAWKARLATIRVGNELKKR